MGWRPRLRNFELAMCDVYENNMQVNEVSCTKVGKVVLMMVEAVVVEL